MNDGALVNEMSTGTTRLKLLDLAAGLIPAIVLNA